MDVNVNLNIFNLSRKEFETSGLNQWNPGDKLLIEMMSQESNGDGIILLKGQPVKVHFDFQVQPGERFWVTVRETNSEQVELVKTSQAVQGEENPAPAQPGSKMAAEERPVSMQRGFLINDAYIHSIIRLLPNRKYEWQLWLNQRISENKENQSIEWPDIPQWSDMENDGAGKLMALLRGLGIDYEARITRLLNQPRNPQIIKSSEEEREIRALKQTLKGQVLAELALKKGSESTAKAGIFTDLLDCLTSQQLWLYSGIEENAYFILNLPMRQQAELDEIKIAVEAKRKGKRIDEQHCRIALLTETSNLGALGIDAWFGGEMLQLKLLTANPEEIQELLIEALPSTKMKFTAAGYTLSGIEVASLESNLEFIHFVQGNRRSGVNVLG